MTARTSASAANKERSTVRKRGWATESDRRAGMGRSLVIGNSGSNLRTTPSTVFIMAWGSLVVRNTKALNPPPWCLRFRREHVCAHVRVEGPFIEIPDHAYHHE